MELNRQFRVPAVLFLGLQVGRRFGRDTDLGTAEEKKILLLPGYESRFLCHRLTMWS